MTDKPEPRPLAVALQYERGAAEAPRVTAIGRGMLAERIVAMAGANDVVIEANPMLAEALSGVEIDEEIPIELYESVAVVIGFVMRLQQRK